MPAGVVCGGARYAYLEGDAQMTLSVVIPPDDKAELDEALDAIENEILRLQNLDYASPEAQALIDFEAKIVLAEYLRTK
jgi:hypothetical protein